MEREYGLQPKILKGELEHLVNHKSNFAGLGHIWEPYLKLDMSCLAFINGRLSVKIKKMSGFGIKDCLTKASL